MTKYAILSISILIGANAGAAIGKILPSSRAISGQFTCSYYEKTGPESYNALIQEVNDNCDSNKHFQTH